MPTKVTRERRTADRRASPPSSVLAAVSADGSDFFSSADEPKAIELVFGMVGPTGVDLTRLCNSLQAQLKSVGYECKIVRLSELILPYLGKPPTARNEFQRIDELMTEGTNLRRETKQADIIGRLGLAKIRELREGITGDANKVPDRGVAYIVRSFKRPEEVKLYRDVYGRAFSLISCYSPRQGRVQHLTRKFRGLIGQESSSHVSAEEFAVRLIKRDYEEEGKLGQQLGRTFPLADFFVSEAARNQLDAQMRRLVRLVFGDPYISPTRDEQGMFFAQAAALRSLDLSRQVGAAVVNSDGDILATGCNEVPKFRGGLYWAGDETPVRDVELGRDSNTAIKEELLEDAVQRMREKGWLSSLVSGKTDGELARSSLYGEDPFFRDSRLFDVIEFGRAVHAEMAAITQAAKLGTSLKGSRLFCTTFPCHICARHIVASGIVEVMFIEPYEKSRTGELYSDSISVEPAEPSPNRANFRSFVGVAPRRYMDFFSMASERKTKEGETLDSDGIASRPRIRRLVFTYLSVEQMMINKSVLPPTQSQL
ncbi:anti-phage dCTP deaminase [Piscinibacter sakaiensis]|uniref:anti-phage dCTP deaminase n=1 Tax=Piscinibacter sakaiensis TaxID=1547922 RepID=UPI003AAF3BFF